MATTLDLSHHHLLHRAFETPHGLGRASLFRFISCPWPLHPLSSSLLETHLVRFHFWPFESITLYTWTISSSSSLGQLIANLDLTSSKKPLQSSYPELGAPKANVLYSPSSFQSHLPSYLVFPTPASPPYLEKCLRTAFQCPAPDRYPKVFAECCFQMVESGL